jgi:hypothetical protein
MSSSMASQCIPMPPPIGSQSLRCCGVAARSRGNHTNGTETVRPSSRTTINESSEHETSTADTSPLSTEVGIPLLQKKLSILDHELSNRRQFVTAKTTIRRQRYLRIKPELRVTPGLGHMNVWRLAVLKTVEEEPVPANPQQGWHSISLLRLLKFDIGWRKPDIRGAQDV